MTKSNYEIGRSLVSFAYQTDLANNLPSEKNSMSKMVDDFVAKVKAEEPTEFELPDIPGVEPVPLYHLGRGLWGDIKRRARWYLSDYVDGVNNVKSVSKSISATGRLFFQSFFLNNFSFSFLCLPPAFHSVWKFERRSNSRRNNCSKDHHGSSIWRPFFRLVFWSTHCDSFDDRSVGTVYFNHSGFGRQVTFQFGILDVVYSCPFPGTITISCRFTAQLGS